MSAEFRNIEISQTERNACIAFVSGTIGKPWVPGAQGPDAFDCWGLARVTQRTLFNRDLPIVACAADAHTVDRDDLRAVMRAMESADLRAGWVQASEPQHGDIVLLSSRKYPSHIGTYLGIDRGGIHHVTREGDVRFDPLALMKVMGWVRFEFFRPALATDVKNFDHLEWSKKSTPTRDEHAP